MAVTIKKIPPFAETYAIPVVFFSVRVAVYLCILPSVVWPECGRRVCLCQTRENDLRITSIFGDCKKLGEKTKNNIDLCVEVGEPRRQSC